MLNIAVLVSGSGSNLQAVIDGIESGSIEKAQISLVISSNSKAYALERAKKHGIRALVLGKEEFPDMEQRSRAILHALCEARADLLVLAGYMSVLPPELIQEYKGKIINIHPSLIPKFCGKGFYGRRVHQAVLDAGERESGATVHFVDEGIDTGPVILQERVPVEEEDTPESLGARVLIVEHRILTEAVRQLARAALKGGN